MGGKGERGDQKPPIRASDFKVLAAFLQGYLHQDFLVDHKTPLGALAAFRREAAPEEVTELKSEIERFLEGSRILPFATVQRIFTGELHSGWMPQSREDLVRLLEGF